MHEPRALVASPEANASTSKTTDVKTSHVLPGVVKKAPSAASIPTRKATAVKPSHVFPSGQKLFVVLGDLTAYKVDVIVNAANEHLRHIGGLAKAIVDKGWF